MRQLIITLTDDLDEDLNTVNYVAERIKKGFCSSVFPTWDTVTITKQ